MLKNKIKKILGAPKPLWAWFKKMICTQPQALKAPYIRPSKILICTTTYHITKPKKNNKKKNKKKQKKKSQKS
jgi:hypothetical protein